VNKGTEVTINAQPATGDRCPRGDCPGHLVVYSGHTRGVLHVKYVRCWQCGAKPTNNKIVIPATEVAKRRPRKVLS
jgi:hypothetical protein